MADDDPIRTITLHEVGMAIDTMSVDELRDRIGLLEGEIARLKDAVALREKVKAAAASVFKF